MLGVRVRGGSGHGRARDGPGGAVGRRKKKERKPDFRVEWEKKSDHVPRPQQFTGNPGPTDDFSGLSAVQIPFFPDVSFLSTDSSRILDDIPDLAFDSVGGTFSRPMPDPEPIPWSPALPSSTPLAMHRGQRHEEKMTKMASQLNDIWEWLQDWRSLQTFPPTLPYNQTARQASPPAPTVTSPTQPLSSPAQPPIPATQPSNIRPPVLPTLTTPSQPWRPPTQPLRPPTQPLRPPTQPLRPPTLPVSPPTQTVRPPTQPVRPPTQLLSPRPPILPVNPSALPSASLSPSTVSNARDNSTSIPNYALSLVRKLFTEEEMKGGNCRGVKGKRPLDPSRLTMVRQEVLKHPEVVPGKFPNFWKTICTRAIDEECRRLNRSNKSM
ncbi:formin-like protein 6 [Patiria miniata]|uniref:BEN domain-containing protein n=1 Tax=Patiria miniata TaxID=46514 RepID=A0A913ZXJ8_PATMI|nr:formin-like protein 6 [Patiria miniata]